MTRFSLNLVSGRVLSPEKRRFAFLALVGYLALSGVLLVLAFYHATSVFVSASWMQADMERIEREFKETHPQEDNIFVYAEGLRTEAETLASTLAGVDRCLSGDRYFARILFGLADALPEDTRIISFAMDAEEQSVEIDLAAPVLTAGGRLPSAADIVARWRGDPDLMAELSDIKATASKRMVVDGRAAVVLKFSGTLSKKDV